ncbi:hypothetical protein IE4803_CH01080 [Rhizobium etli bv. phaseoli str. IE4803]|nr:hypothetical protein IE4803_CH01080 [Rhizobium etli bv. phaseoli str. IE4803]
MFKIGQALPPEPRKRLSKTFWESSQNVLDLLCDSDLLPRAVASTHLRGALPLPAKRWLLIIAPDLSAMIGGHEPPELRTFIR